MESVHLTAVHRSVLKMDAQDLHDKHPFTTELVFNASLIWADADHKPMQRACEKATKNLYKHSIIVGQHLVKGPNYWVCGNQDGEVVPYNLHQKLGLIKSNRWPNIMVPDDVKERVCAMYRECELRGISFKKPKIPKKAGGSAGQSNAYKPY